MMKQIYRKDDTGKNEQKKNCVFTLMFNVLFSHSISLSFFFLIKTKKKNVPVKVEESN